MRKITVAMARCFCDRLGRESFRIQEAVFVPERGKWWLSFQTSAQNNLVLLNYSLARQASVVGYSGKIAYRAFVLPGI